VALLQLFVGRGYQRWEETNQSNELNPAEIPELQCTSGTASLLEGSHRQSSEPLMDGVAPAQEPRRNQLS